MQSPSKSVKRAGNGAPHLPPAVSPAVDPFSTALLAAMLAFREGNFSVRMPSDITGVNGKIADTFNDIAAISESRARETVRVAHTVGKEGKLKQRMSLMNVARRVGRRSGRHQHVD